MNRKYQILPRNYTNFCEIAVYPYSMYSSASMLSLTHIHTMYTHAHTQLYTYAHTHTHTHIDTDTHTHAHMHRHRRSDVTINICDLAYEETSNVYIKYMFHVTLHTVSLKSTRCFMKCGTNE